VLRVQFRMSRVQNIFEFLVPHKQKLLYFRMCNNRSTGIYGNSVHFIHGKGDRVFETLVDHISSGDECMAVQQKLGFESSFSDELGFEFKYLDKQPGCINCVRVQVHVFRRILDELGFEFELFG
jgi:hypothetical protein